MAPYQIAPARPLLVVLLSDEWPFPPVHRTFCIYLATGEEAIRKHAETGGFPITSIHEVKGIIDPSTAAGAQQA